MVTFDQSFGSAVTVPFTSAGLATGKTAFALTVLKDNVVTTITPTYAEIGGGFYTLTFTPSATGRYVFFIESALQAMVNVVTRDMYTILRNVEDEAIGSWTWDKVAGTLTMVRQDGTTLATFAVTDTLNSASRERQ